MSSSRPRFALPTEDVPLQRPFRRFRRNREMDEMRHRQEDQAMENATTGTCHGNPTSGDALLARQLQYQEGIGQGDRTFSTLGDVVSRAFNSIDNITVTPDDIAGMAQTPPQVNVHIINRRHEGFHHNPSRFQRNNRQYIYFHRRPDNPRGAPTLQGEDLPEGELDPTTTLLGDGWDNQEQANYLNVMQDPGLMLLMLLSRTPHMMVPNNIDLDSYDTLWNLAERMGDVHRRGLTDAQMARLTQQTFAAEDPPGGFTECRVCLTDFLQDENIRVLVCNHVYHTGCIDNWLRRNATCPICRRVIE